MDQQDKLMKYKREYDVIADVGQKPKALEKHDYERKFVHHHHHLTTTPHYNPQTHRQKNSIEESFPELDHIKSIYLHGEPGCGKSHLMDIFY